LAAHDPSATRVILVRHGETDWNAEGRIQGHLDIPLNERGRAQAAAVGDCLATRPVGALYSSDLLRARQTAEAIARRGGHSVRTDQRMREWDLGILSGLLRTAAADLHPEAFRILRDRVADQPVPGGESIRARSQRVTAAVQEIADRHRGRAVVIVTHGGPLGDCYRHAIGEPPESRVKVELFNAGINLISVREDAWTIEAWGAVEHLEDVGTLGNWEGRSPR
jgi:probable phosphoglycerate mutase